jgi:pimeloyl-ACP methyl ester carboxylesterase
MAKSPVASDSIDIHVEGAGAETIVMVHGYPDTYRLWDATVAALKDRFRCIRFTLPGFDKDKPRRTCNLDELCGFLKQVIEQHCPGQKVILMLHDWGCVFGYQFYNRHPGMVSKIVGVDIGDPVSASEAMTGREVRFVLAYQWWLALAWKIGGRIGDRMSRAMLRKMRCPSDLAHFDTRMNYPYWVTWFGGEDSYRRQWKPFNPACPMLFIFGARKPIRFHSPAWIEQLMQRDGNRVVEFSTGHWVMLQQPERFNEVVGAWLSGKQ